MFRKGAAAMIAASMLVAAPAQAACWNADEVSAAKVRDLETMMMVSALRCRISGHDFLGKYNHFIRSSRAALSIANDRLRGHFTAAGTGLNGYDRYVTQLANRYGAGAEGLSCRDMSSIVDAAVSSSNSFDRLVDLAERAEVQPLMAGGVCKTVTARR
jgi:hypothetical protein